MKYCRKDNFSDIFAVQVDDGYECVGCNLLNCTSVFFKKPEGLYNHLVDHARNGHIVPGEIIRQLIVEMNDSQHTAKRTSDKFRKLGLEFSATQRVLEKIERHQEIYLSPEDVNKILDIIGNLKKKGLTFEERHELLHHAVKWI